MAQMLTRKLNMVLHHYIFNWLGRENEILEYIHKYGVRECDSSGMTALHIAARRRDSRIVETFLKEGADIEAKNNKGLTSLHIAVLEDATNEIEIFVRNGA